METKMTKEEAINIVRNIYQTDKEKEALATLIPELAESEEQMDALERTIHLSNFGLEEDRRKALVSLYEQLKKLM